MPNMHIEKSKEYCMWTLDGAGIEKDTTLTVAKDVVAVIYKNEITTDNDRVTYARIGAYNLLPRKEAKKIHSLKIVCANVAKETCPWGVGGIYYKDWKNKVETVVGAHGTYAFAIRDPELLSEAFGEAEKVTTRDVQIEMKKTIERKIGMALQKALEEADVFGDPRKVFAGKVEEMQQDLEYELKRSFEEKGINLISLEIDSDLFLQDDYLALFAKKPTAPGGGARPVSMSDNGFRQPVKPKKYCPNCNAEVSDDDYICIQCGQKLK